MLVSDSETPRTILLSLFYPESARQTDGIGTLLVCWSDEYIVKRELYPRDFSSACGLLRSIQKDSGLRPVAELLRHSAPQDCVQGFAHEAAALMKRANAHVERFMSDSTLRDLVPDPLKSNLTNWVPTHAA